MSEIDLREAMNAASDVVQDRPRPIRQFDQICMKSGDMAMQTEFVARRASGKLSCFIDDGDAISVRVAYLQACLHARLFGCVHLHCVTGQSRAG
ncbi:MAG: hypothetical protein F4213_17505 [Boseongicola sp. SB0677_bin_26]|nr:hypothetical protein [Boseongicola sp. SB0665_bin_10]MYG27791.1 hypothetical protein [Boseongicola sp. SB0677_bin_26]